ncbi:hypothetical protein [Priestia megaterium]|uniref:hypothetical protein n=1 Tax=Priestia megaterium TaxID=1404 RepID=UPI002FFFEDAF
MKISDALERILEDYTDRVLEGNDVLIALKDGIVTLVKGDEGEAPIIIKVDMIEENLNLTLKEVFGE